MRRHRVWVDDWQMQCCGEPFELGATVRWTVRALDQDWLSSFLDATEVRRFTDAEDHHDVRGTDVRTLDARVTSIDAVFCGYAPSGRSSGLLVPIPGSGILRMRRRVDGWEEESGDTARFGYAVDLEEGA